MSGAGAWLHDDFVTSPFWWDAAPLERTQPPPLPERVDVAVVGGGYCGLSAAIELARAGTAVAVLDRDEIGFGASSRNGGMVSGAVKLSWAGIGRRFGGELARDLFDDARRSFQHLEDLVRREALDADYRRSGSFLAACSPAHFRALRHAADQVGAFARGDVRLVARDDQRAEIGSDLFHGGLVVAPAGGLDPARFHRSLRSLAVQAGARQHGRTAVQAYRRDSGAFILETSRGRLRAASLVVATNGYTGRLTPALRRRVVPVSSYIIATEPLPADLARRLNPNGRMLIDSNRLLSYFRLAPDGRRILFGGRLHLRDVDERTAASGLHRRLIRVWPETAAFRITHGWKGSLGFTFDHLPHMGELDGVHFAMGCNGSGIAMATFLGHQTALKLLGRLNRPCAFERIPFPSHPLYRHRPWFLPAVGAWYRLRDRIDGFRG